MSVYIENFETIFGIRNNIQALKNKVLQLALQGRLVEQDQNDVPASELVKKIRVLKDKLVKEGKINKQKPLKPINHGEILFEIPQNWEWVRLSEVVDTRDGTHDSPKYVEQGYPLVTSKNISSGKLDLRDTKLISKEDYLKISERSSVDRSDILFAMIGTIGNPVIVTNDEKFAIKNVALFKPGTYGHLNPKYLKYFLEYAQLFMNVDSSGGVQKFVSLSFLREYPIPIPPQAEQDRIVAKVESLMLEIDKLEEALQKKQQLMDTLPKAVVDAIGNCQTGHELKEQLQLGMDNFESIFQTPESMQELRNVILQLAIEGKLVPQDSDGEPASELVKRIRIQRDKLVREGKIKKQQPLAPIEEDEIPFEIPDGWEWVRLGELGITQTGTTPKTSVKEYYCGHVPFIKPADISSKGINYNNESLTSLGLEAGRLVRENSNMMVCIGGSIGKTYFSDRDCSCNQQINTLTPFAGVNYLYIHLVMQSPYFHKQVWNKSSGTATPIINKSTWDSILVPLPPEKEQHRIIPQVEAVMNLIDQMEYQLERKVDLVEKMASV